MAIGAVDGVPAADYVPPVGIILSPKGWKDF